MTEPDRNGNSAHAHCHDVSAIKNTPIEIAPVESADAPAAKRAHERAGTSARSKARRRAVEVLFEAEQRHCNSQDVIQRRKDNTDQIINDYTLTILTGVEAQKTTIDEFLETYAHGWTLERMPNVDRAILRAGAWELLYNDDIPDPVAVSEAVYLARTLSTDDSPQFVNGLLSRLQELKPTLLA